MTALLLDRLSVNYGPTWALRDLTLRGWCGRRFLLGFELAETLFRIG